MMTWPYSRSSPRWDSMGRVAKTEGDRLILDDARGDVTELPITSARIEARHGVFQSCLGHVFGKASPRIEGFLEEALSGLRVGPARLEKIEKLLDYLGGRPLTLLPKVSATFQRFFEEGTHSRPVRSSEPDEKIELLMSQMRNDRAFPPVCEGAALHFCLRPNRRKDRHNQTTRVRSLRALHFGNLHSIAS